MSKHLDIKLECVGDVITALSEATRLCKAGNYETLYVFFKDLNLTISVHKDSNITDLFQIYSLNHKLKTSCQTKN